MYSSAAIVLPGSTPTLSLPLSLTVVNIAVRHAISRNESASWNFPLSYHQFPSIIQIEVYRLSGKIGRRDREG